MRKKKKLKVKLPSSKKVSTGMTESKSFSNPEDLKVILRDERLKDLSDKQKVTRLKIENQELREYIKWHPFEKLGDKNSWTMPVTDVVNKEMLEWEDYNARIMQLELTNIFAFSINVIMCMFISFVFLAWLLWP